MEIVVFFGTRRLTLKIKFFAWRMPLCPGKGMMLITPGVNRGLTATQKPVSPDGA